MKREQLKSLITVGFFMLVTGVAMGSLNQDKPIETPQPPDVVMNGDIVTLSGRLIQDKIFSGGDGTMPDRLSGILSPVYRQETELH
jgi:hypothetical protein